MAVLVAPPTPALSLIRPFARSRWPPRHRVKQMPVVHHIGPHFDGDVDALLIGTALEHLRVRQEDLCATNVNHCRRKRTEVPRTKDLWVDGRLPLDTKSHKYVFLPGKQPDRVLPELDRWIRPATNQPKVRSAQQQPASAIFHSPVQAMLQWLILHRPSRPESQPGSIHQSDQATIGTRSCCHLAQRDTGFQVRAGSQVPALTRHKPSPACAASRPCVLGDPHT